MKFFIKRPQALIQFRNRAGFSEDHDLEELEEILRSALEKGAKCFVRRQNGDAALRLAVPNQNVVYAITETARSIQGFDFVIRNILTPPMFEQWAREKIEENKTEPEEEGSDVFLRYPNGNSNKKLKAVPIAKVASTVEELVNEGVRFKDIEVFKRIPLKFEVKIPEIKE